MLFDHASHWLGPGVLAGPSRLRGSTPGAAVSAQDATTHEV